MNVQVHALSGVTPNTTYDSASFSANEAQISQMLRDAERKASKGYGAGHVVNSADINAQDKELKKACKGFESMFLQMMYRQMRSTVPEDTLFGESHALKIFQDMRDDELMKKTAEAGGIGLGELLYKQLEPQVLAQAEAMQKQENR